MIERNHIYCMDCIDGMAQMADKSIDLAIVDPPYGIGRDKGFMGFMGFGGSGKPIARKRYHGNWDNEPPNKKYFDELMRVAKNAIVWGGQFFTDKLPVSGHWLFWDKRNTMPTFGDGELAWTSFNRHSVKRHVLEWNGLLGKEEGGRIHATQKPIALYKWLLQNYAKQGNLILDTHMGSGSSYIACLDMRFDYIGFEIDPDYFAAIEERAYHAIRQLSLFEGNPRSDVT